MRVAGEHRRDPFRQAGTLGEVDQQPEGLVGDPVLRPVDVHIHGVDGHGIGAARVAREELAEVEVGDDALMAGNGPPLGEHGQVDHEGLSRRHAGVTRV